MAVPIEFFSVVVPKDIIRQKYKGGMKQYKTDCPNTSYKEDKFLTRIGFMDDYILHVFCEGLIKSGLYFDEESNSSEDFVVVQRLQGLHWNVFWLDLTDDGGQAFYIEKDL